MGAIAGTSAALTTLLAQLALVGVPATITPQAYYAVGDGIADDTIPLRNFFDACHALQVEGAASPNDVFRITGPVAVTLPTRFNMRGATIAPDKTGYGLTGTGYAIGFQGSDGTAQSNLKSIAGGISLQGVRSTSSVLDGVGLGGTGVNVSNIDFPGWTIDGFRDHIYFGDNTYLVDWQGLVSNNYWRYSENYNCVNNGGENITFHGGATSSGRNGGTAIAVFSSTGNPFLDVGHYGMSFDYGDQIFFINTGIFDFYDPHFENGNQYVMGSLVYTSGRPHPAVYIHGGDICFGTGGLNRPALFSVNGACTLVIRDMPMATTDAMVNTQIIAVVGAPLKIVHEMSPNIGGLAGAPFMCNYTNKLFNFALAAAISTGWTTSLVGSSGIDTSNTYTLNGTTYNAVKFILDATNPQYILQRSSVRPGGTILVGAGTYASGLTSGTGQITTTFYAQDGTTVVQAETVRGNTISAAQAYTSNGNIVRIPQGAALVDVKYGVTPGVGTVNFAAPGVWDL